MNVNSMNETQLQKRLNYLRKVNSDYDDEDIPVECTQCNWKGLLFQCEEGVCLNCAASIRNSVNESTASSTFNKIKSNLAPGILWSYLREEHPEFLFEQMKDCLFPPG